MAKQIKLSPEQKEKILIEVDSHYQDWNEDNNKRRTRKDGWDDVTDAYWGKLPDDWPFISRVVDPRIRTSILEKNARLTNGKLRGRLAPREGGDILGAKINNTLLDYQWDSANDGGSMSIKMSISDMDARLYASKFALIKWRYEEDEDGNVIFDGNEFYPLDIRDCGLDPAASHIRDAKWFQHREWMFVEDLEKKSDSFPGLDKLLSKIKQQQSNKAVRSSERKNEYVSRIKTIKGLEDRVGSDIAFPMVEIVTEYRKDMWITFSPEHKVILRVIENPYEHGKIPVSQLRYYPLQDDPYGESEVEPVLPLWRAIQATICSYMDETLLKMRPPLKVIEGEARVETIVYGPEAQWLVNRQDAIQEMQSNGEAVRYFQTTYSALVSAFNQAMGDLSQGVGGMDPFTPEKTATEITATVQQRNVRDQKNQNDLAEFIKDFMSMWMSNNKQFLFSKPDKREHIIRIVGSDMISYFRRAGLDQMTVSNDSMKLMASIISESGGEVSDTLIQSMIESAQEPLYPIIENPQEKDPEKIIIKPKMRLSETGEDAEISLVPEDLDGTYDYIPDVKSMAVGATEEFINAKARAIEQLQNPIAREMLGQEGFKPKLKDLYVDTLEDMGLRDAERYFEKIEQNATMQPNGRQEIIDPRAQEAGGVGANIQESGLSGVPQANSGVSSQEQVAGSIGV